jgi:hypothetical protein
VSAFRRDFDLDEVRPDWMAKLNSDGVAAGETGERQQHSQGSDSKEAERQRDCRTWLDEEGEVARESRAAIRKRIVTAHPSTPLEVVSLVS